MTEFQRHLSQRGLTTLIRSWIDYENEIVTFPLTTVDKWVGYQRYNWRSQNKGKVKNDEKGRYYTYISEAYTRCACYGFNMLHGVGPLFIVEGIWDAVRLHNVGADCLALLTSTPCKQMRQYIRQVFPNRLIVAAPDNDAAGKKLTGWCDLVVNLPPTVKDVNELTPDECDSWLSLFHL